ncbi:unnamed protein product [Mortierella alpina]
MVSHQRGNNAPPSPSSPATPTSVQSGKSRHSSFRRNAVSSAAAQAAAAEDLADQQSLKVISRSMSSYRVVHLLYQTDADLFDAIQDWKDNHPTLWVDDAIDAFATARGSDALAQLVYSTEAFDIVLKYTASYQDLGPLFDDHTRNDRSRSPPTSPQRTSPNRQPSPCDRMDGAEGGALGLAEVTSLTSGVPHTTSSVPPNHSGQYKPDASARPSSKIFQLRHVPANLLSRAVSLASPSRSRAPSPQHPAQGQPVNAPHVALPMSSSNSAPDLPLQLLQPFDCSTDFFPSMQASQQLQTMYEGDQSNNRAALDEAGSSTAACSEQILSMPQQDQGFRHSLKQRSNRPSKAKMRDWKVQLHRREFQLSLLKEGLFLELEKSVDSDAVYVKVLAPFWRLAEEAQKTNCKADLASTILPSIPYASRIFPSITRLFPCLSQPGLEQRREAVLFKTARLTDFHLAEPGRRWSDVVRHAGAAQRSDSQAGSHSGTDGRPGLFQTSRRGYLVNSIMMRTESRNHPYGRKMGLRSALRRGAYQKLYALHDGSFKLHSKSIHDANQRAQLRIKWAKRFWRSQPLDLVNAYYGERIGVYFAWLGHYTKWLTLPAAVGMAVFVYGIINAARLNKLDATPNALFAIFDNVLTMPFALFMSMWSTVYIEFWKRANQYYAFRWNMSDYERVELPRTEFRATKVRFSPVTGKRELYYPMYWKALRILASSIAVLIAVAVVIGSVACLMIFKAWCRHHIGGPYATVVATAVLNLIIIIILGEIWCRLAEWLTDKENHKYTDAYEDSLIIKRYLFDFTNMYATLFYYAFFKAPFGGRIFTSRPDLQDACLYDACITELTVQLAVVFIGKQFLNGLFEMVFPWMKRTWNRKKILADQALKKRKFMETRKRTKAPQWVKDDELPSYRGRILKCYRKTVIQFGFCTLFVTSFPVAPAFALINNWIDIRMEAFRLLTQYRRPIAFRAQDIGMWELIMEFVSFTSVITNAAIIAFSSLWVKQNIFIKVLHATTDGELLAARLGFILVFEHVVYLFKIILRAAIPNVPLTIKLAVQRSKYMTRVANEGLDSEIDEDLDLDDDSGSQTDDEGEEDDDDAGSHDSDSGPQPGPGLQRRSGRQSAPHDGSRLPNSGPATRRRLFGLQRLWNRAATRKQSNGGRVSERESRSVLQESGQSPGSVLPTIQESASRVGSNSILNSRRDRVVDPRLKAPIDVNTSGVQQLQEQGQPVQGQHGQPPMHAIRPPVIHTDQLNAGPSSGQRRPVPQRANTDMDGEWVVLEEARM